MADQIVKILVDQNGNFVHLTEGTAVTASTPGVLVEGKTGAGLTVALGVNGSGQLSIQNPSNLDVALSGVLGSLGQKTMAGSTPVVLASNQSAIPVSGSVTANVGTTGGLALDATLINGTLKGKITDGTNVVAVKAASTAPVATDNALVVAISPNSVLNVADTNPANGTNGSAIPAQSLLVAGKDGSGNLRPLSVSTAGVVFVDASATTQPISGTVTANLGTVAGLALDATLTGGTQKTILRGGSKGSTAVADLTSTAEGANHQALDVQLYSAGVALDPTQIRALTSADQITVIPQAGSTYPSTITNGVNTAAVKAASTAAVAADPALVVSLSPNSALPSGSNSIGSVTANVGTTNGLALDATLTGGTTRTKITDGTNNAAVKAASTAAVAADPALVVSVSPNTTVKVDGSGSTQPVSGTVTVVQATGSSLNAVVEGKGTAGSTSGGVLSVQGVSGGTPVPVSGSISGTVTANIGTTGGLALDATMTGGTQKAINRGGAKGATTAADITSTAEGVDHQALDVQLYSGGAAIDPTQIRALTATDVVTSTQGTPTSVGNAWPTKMTDGTRTATVKAASTAAAAADTALVVAISPNNTVGVSGTVTSNIGTTNGLALDATITGGTQKSQLVDGSGNVASVSGTGALKVDAGTISGTVTANIGTTGGLALDTTLTGGSQRNRITDGTNTAAVKAASASAVATDPALVVAISPNNTVGVSGTVTSNIGTTNGLALDATLTGGTQKNRITDGTNTAAVKAASTAPLATDPALVVAISPNSVISVTATEASMGVNGSAIPTSSTQVGGKDGSGNLQPLKVSTAGVLSVDIGVNTIGLALDATLTGGTQKTIARGGAKGATTAADVTSVSVDANIQALHVQIAGQGTSGTPLRTDPTGTTTQPVSAASLPLPTGAASESTLSALNNKTPSLGQAAMTGSSPVVIASDQSAVPVSGTVTANVGTTNGLALNATLTGGTAQNRITDGTNVATVKAASTAAVAADKALVVAVSPNNTVTVDGSAVTQPVSGTVTSNIGTTNGLALDATLTGGTQKTKLVDSAGTNLATISAGGALKVDASATTQPVSGTVTVAQATASSLNATVVGSGSAGTAATGVLTVQGIASMVALKVDGSAVTQPVSGTVTSNVGTTGGLALDATLTGGTQRNKITDGTNNAAVKAGSTAPVAADPALVVTISPNSSITVTAIEASVGLTGAAVPTSATQSAGVDGSGNLRALKVSTAGVLSVDGSAVTQPVSGTVTANAGTGTFGTNLAQVAGSSASTVATGVLKVGVSDSAGASFLSAANALNSTGTGVQATQMVGQFDDVSPTTITENQFGNLRMSANRNLYGTIRDAAGNERGVNVTSANALTVDGSGVTQPVSGTITANIGTTNGLALDATLTGGTQKTKLVDSAGTNLATISSGGALKVDGSAVVQPISGTTTANIGTTGGLALDATLTGGTASSRVTDGTNTASVKAASTAAVATDKALVVAVSPNNTLSVKTEVQVDYDTGAGTQNLSMVGLALPASGGAVAGGTSTNPLRTDPTGTTTQPVSGTVTANVGTTGGLALDATLTGGSAKTKLVDSAGTNLAAISAAGALKVDASATTQPVSGTVTVAQATASSLNATVVGSGTAGTAATGVLTVQGIASMVALKVDGSAVTQPVSGTVTSNVGTTGGLALDATLTGGTAQNRITDGTNVATVKAASTAAVATDKALVVAISPNNPITVTAAADATATGALGALNAAITVTHPGLQTAGFQLAAGTLAATLVAEASFDGGTTWVGTFFRRPSDDFKTSSIVLTNPNSAQNYVIVGVGGAGQTRVRVSAYTAGTASGTVRASDMADTQPLFSTAAGGTAPPSVAQVGGVSGGLLNALAVDSGGRVTSKLSDGTNSATISAGGALKVDGSAVTQPVSGTVSVTQATASSLNATVVGSGTAGTAATGVLTVQGIASMVALKVDGSAVTQPVSGTVTANVGTTNGLALDATLAKLTVAQGTALGTNTQALVGGSVTTAAPSYTTGQISPLSMTTAGAVRVDASGTTQPVSGTITVAQATASSLNATVVGSGSAGTAATGVVTVQGIASMVALKVDGSAVTQPISGTTTANIGTTGGLALDATLTGGTTRSKITDGTSNAAVKAASTAAVAADPALVVAISPNNVLVTKTTSGTATLTNVSSSATAVSLLSSNTARIGATIYNDSTKILYVNFGGTASTTAFTVKMDTDSYYEVPFGYTGAINGIWSAANGSARVTELT